ncbi:unnamed protein product, partial [Prorocentrum cordatum]
ERGTTSEGSLGQASHVAEESRRPGGSGGGPRPRSARIDNLRYPTQALNAGYTGSLSTRGNQTGTKVGAGPGDPPTTRTWPRPGPPVALVRQPGGSLLQDIPRNDSAVHCSCAVHRQRVKRHGSPRRRGARTRRKASIVASGKACTPSLDASSQAEAGAAGPPARRPRGPQRWAARERQREAAAATLPMGRREEEETGGEEKGERRREGRENNDRHKAL